MAQNKRQERLQARRQKERRGQMRNMALIGVAAVALVGWIAWNNFRPIPEAPPRNHPMPNGTRLGNPDAPVVFEEFADFLCSHCQTYFDDTAERIIEEYVATGDVYYVFHAVPFISQGSQIAAEGAYCAADQARFWDFHDDLFDANRFADNPTSSGMINRAERLGLEMDTFEECLDSSDKADIILENADYAASLGVGGTPAFVINGQLAIEGAQPFEAFQQAIESVLASSN